jgi:hypothetical protein
MSETGAALRPSARPPAPRRGEDAAIEKAFLFGERKTLVGIVTDPAPGTPKAGVAVVILNAGMLHRVGPSRVHVELARRLAASGFVCLRFDHSGIGDSVTREDGLPFAVSTVRETQEAMNFLAGSRGIERFVLVGVCSGADNALRACAADTRVVGAALIDGYNLPAVSRVFRIYARRLLSLQSWARLLRGRSLVWSTAKSVMTLQRATESGQSLYESLLPSRQDYVAQVRALCDRGVRLFMVYTGESPGYFNYLKLLRRRVRRWPSRDHLRFAYASDCDHQFTLRATRQRLVDSIHDWAVSEPR